MKGKKYVWRKKILENLNGIVGRLYIYEKFENASRIYRVGEDFFSKSGTIQHIKKNNGIKK